MQSKDKIENQVNMTKDKVTEQEAENKEVSSAQEQTGDSAQSAETQGNEASENDNMSEATDSSNDNSEKLADPAKEWQDKYLRLSAEFDNYRKRTLKEKMDLIAAGGEDVIKAMLNVVDDMDRAMVAMQTSTDLDAIKEGITLISQKLAETMRSKGVSELEAMGQELDTDIHEAIAIVPAPNPEQKGKIIDVVQKGYKLKDKVIRHAKVVVGEK